MSRPLRIEFESAYYHVMNRGRGRQAIFHGEDYFTAFLKGLAEAHGRFGLEVHAYCLMSNHYHLLVKTPHGNLQRAMRHIGGVYTQRYNRLKKTDGPLFRGRYKAIVVDHDAYLLHLSQYIHRNPLEATMVDDLEAYPWSSYPSYIGIADPPSWLYRDEVYGQLQVRRQKQEKYRHYVMRTEQDASLVEFYSRERLGSILGEDDFVKDVLAEGKEWSDEIVRAERLRFTPSLDDITEYVANAYKVPVEMLRETRKGRGMKNQPRKVAMYLGQTLGGCRLTEIADYFNLSHYGGASYAIYSVKPGAG